MVSKRIRTHFLGCVMESSCVGVWGFVVNWGPSGMRTVDSELDLQLPTQAATVIPIGIFLSPWAYIFLFRLLCLHAIKSLN